MKKYEMAGKINEILGFEVPGLHKLNVDETAAFYDGLMRHRGQDADRTQCAATAGSARSFGSGSNK